MQTLAADVLAAWRRAERLAAQALPGSRDQRTALDACERLRDLYQDLVHQDGQPAAEELRARLEQLSH
jgi:hypothetical protein